MAMGCCAAADAYKVSKVQNPHQSVRDFFIYFDTTTGRKGTFKQRVQNPP